MVVGAVIRYSSSAPDEETPFVSLSLNDSYSANRPPEAVILPLLNLRNHTKTVKYNLGGIVDVKSELSLIVRSVSYPLINLSLQ